MSTEKTENTQSIMQKFLPVDGKIAYGASVQTDAAGLAKIGVTKMKAALKERLNGTLAAKAEATRALNEATKKRYDACTAVEVPEELFKDLDGLVKPMQKFHPGAEVKRTDREGAALRVSAETFNFDTGKYRAAASIVVPGVGAVFNAPVREYAISKATMDLHVAVLDAQTQVADCEADLQDIQRAMADLPDFAERMEAVLIEDGMKDTTEGAKAMASMERGLNAALAAIDAKLDRRALPAKKGS